MPTLSITKLLQFPASSPPRGSHCFTCDNNQPSRPLAEIRRGLKTNSLFGPHMHGSSLILLV